ncbi:MAG TPA: hypothetical protein VKA46_20875 [Gemmataceae bacterium]|nr:hypothetical protein [Gemmataceae bacterium]
MDVANNSTAPAPRRTGLWLAALLAALVLGAVLRLVWVKDIEFKSDEAWTFRQVQQAAQGGPWPQFGMPSSAGPVNPGLSVWVFVLLGKLTGCPDPTVLARGVQVLSIAAILCLIVFAFVFVPPKEREPWLWAAALVSVNPTAVLLHRKIWPPSLLPLFTLVMLAGWFRRERRWGAFLWGLVGACLGQIHMAGFFFAAGFALWALLFDRKRVAWSGWLLGSCLGALPMLPWLYYLLSDLHRGGPSSVYWVHLFEFKFWVRWVMQSLGFGLEYSLFDDHADFLSYPLLHGQPTYLVWVAEQTALLLGALLLARAAYRAWRGRDRLAALVSGKGSPTGFTLGAAFWGFGLLLTATSLYMQRHYLAVAFPLGFVWLARLALPATDPRPAGVKVGRGILLTLCLCQALLTASFLDYIHAHHGSVRGDYKATFGAAGHAALQSGPVPRQ